MEGEPLDLIKRREMKLAAEKLWRQRFIETLDTFPVVPFGERVIVFQRRPEHKTKSGLLLPQSQNAPLSGWVVAVPGAILVSERPSHPPGDPILEPNAIRTLGPQRRLVVQEAHLVICIGDSVLFPDHAAHRISVMVGNEGEEQKEQEFLVIEARDLHGVVVAGRVESLSEVVPGLEESEHVTGEAVNRATAE